MEGAENYHCQCPLHPEITIEIKLFKEVSNAPELKKMVLNGQIDAALIKPALIVDKLQVLTAATKAIHANKVNRKITRTLHSEVLYCLSGSKNITESFKRFGLEDKDNTVLIVVITEKDQSGSCFDETQVKGTQVPVNIVGQFTDQELVKKTYKIKSEELKCYSILDCIISRISSKDILTV